MTTTVTSDHPCDTFSAETICKLMLAELCACLSRHAITSVTITYDGYGDEGQIEETELKDTSGELVTMPPDECKTWVTPMRGELSEVVLELGDALDEFSYTMLAQNHAGWENGEGAFGELLIDVAARKAELQHSMRFIETAETIHEVEA